MRCQGKAWHRRTNRNKTKIQWKFTRKLARLKLNYSFRRSQRYALAEQLRKIFSQEQEHQHDLATALGIDVPNVFSQGA